MQTRLSSLLVAAALLAGCSQQHTPSAERGSGEEQAAVGDFRLAGPHVHENLAVYLVLGDDRIPAPRYLTLAEAMERKLVVVRETGDVNQLTIENVSGEVDVFIQAGEIVRGGQQDRVLGVDLILPPHSGPVAISAFCVEAGRWSQRGYEPVGFFALSAEMPDSKLMYSINTGDQEEVWGRVQQHQADLSERTASTVVDADSPTSLLLTLENTAVQAGAQSYVDALTGAAAAESRALGAVFIVGGEIRSADLYAGRDLFLKYWPRLLEAAAVEALTEKGAADARPAPSAEHVRAFLVAAEGGRSERREPAPRVNVVRRHTAPIVMSETFDQQQPNAWLHRSYLSRPARGADRWVIRPGDRVNFLLDLRDSHANHAELTACLATIRNALSIYQSEHNSTYPLSIAEQLTRYTDIGGTTSPTKTAAACYGPYLLQFPPCPVGPNARGAKANQVLVCRTDPVKVDEDSGEGWVFNPTTGELRANTDDVDDAGTHFYEY